MSLSYIDNNSSFRGAWRIRRSKRPHPLQREGEEHVSPHDGWRDSMRFAAIATIVAAIVATPLALASVGPTMTGPEFLNAARCAGYQSFTQADQGWVQAGLNAEARRQPAAIAATA